MAILVDVSFGQWRPVIEAEKFSPVVEAGALARLGVWHRFDVDDDVGHVSEKSLRNLGESFLNKGGEYVGDLFSGACASLGVTQSMGRVGSALDNAASESWNSTLEHEVLSRNVFETKDQARRAVVRFVDVYNTRRRHSSCEMLPPVAYEQLLADRAAIIGDRGA